MVRGLLLVALAALSWGTTGTMLKLVGATSPEDALLIGAIRMAIAGPLLLVTTIALQRRLVLARGASVIAGLCMAAYQLC